MKAYYHKRLICQYQTVQVALLLRGNKQTCRKNEFQVTHFLVCQMEDYFKAYKCHLFLQPDELKLSASQLSRMATSSMSF